MIESAVINGRTFKVSDRVKVLFQGKWLKGTVASFEPTMFKHLKFLYDEAIQAGHRIEVIKPLDEKNFVTYLDYNYPIIQVRTDEKVTDRGDQLFDGYGVWYTKYSRSIIFEHEEEVNPWPLTIVKDQDKMPRLPF